jgi:hypothetical protein
MTWIRYCIIVLLVGMPLDAAHPTNAEIDRLLRSHDPAVMIAVGRVYVRQTGLTTIRTVLRERGALPS